MYNVLIIDDDKLARKGLISMVEWEKYDLKVVGDVVNGMQALQFLEKNKVDLAFVDLSMPVLSGMEFIEQSRKLYPHLKYVILTFHEDFENVQNALRFGVLDYISKLRLEEMDNEEVFARIMQKMKNYDKREADSHPELEVQIPEMPTSISYEKLEELRVDWTNEGWIYKENVFNSMFQELKNSSIDIRQLERLLMWISIQIQSEFQISCPVPWLADKQQGFECLLNMRKRLYEDSQKDENHYNMRMCILRAILYMREHLGEHINAETVARNVNISRSYFATNFKMITGENYNDFLIDERIEKAKEILRQNPVKTSQLAEMLGYEDSKYFAKIFLRKTGMNCLTYAEQFSSPKNR